MEFMDRMIDLNNLPLGPASDEDSDTEMTTYTIPPTLGQRATEYANQRNGHLLPPRGQLPAIPSAARGYQVMAAQGPGKLPQGPSMESTHSDPPAAHPSNHRMNELQQAQISNSD